MTFKILLVEDETDFRDALRDLLNLEGFSADGVGSIASYMAWRLTHSCDVLIIDRLLPDGDGLDIVRRHRVDHAGPVIFLTAKGQVQDRIAAHELDADYYLVKPVSTDELLAILHSLERRAHGTQPKYWLLDSVGWRLYSANGKSATLSRREVGFLHCFVERAGLTVARSEVIKALGEDPAHYDLRRLEVFVRRLRNRVREASGEDIPLTTVYGKGYAFNGHLRQC
jgi:DNA-binding response OmpR family regulator